MLTTPHVLAGIALATKLPFPWGIPAALLSHFVLDFLVPHWNPHLFTEMKTKGNLSSASLKIIVFDSLLAFLFLVFLSFKALPIYLIWSGALLATLPDLMEIPFYFLKIKNPWLVKYVTFEHHHQAKAAPILGILTQIFVGAISLYFLLF